MRQPVLCVCVASSLIGFAVSAQAQTGPPALDTPCAPNTLAMYESLYPADSSAGCSIGIQNFSDFMFSHTGSTVSDTQIEVTPAIGGFTFSVIDGTFNVLEDQTALYQISYSFDIDPAPIASGASLGADPIFGDVTLDQYYCADSFLDYDDSGARYCQIPDPDTFTPQDLNLSYDSLVPIQSLTTGIVPLNPLVMNFATTELDIALNGNGFATGSGLDSVTGDSFIAPEPSAWLLLSGGLLAIIVRKRISHVSS